MILACVLFVAALICSVNSVSSISFSAQTEPSARPKVLLLSVGGFRMDYLKNTNCLTLEEFINTGVVAQYVQNSINTASLVNHYSIATGLFPESHGIISRTMFDPLMKSLFNKDTRESPEWWKNVNPVWIDNEQQGQGNSGVCRWPGVYGPMVPKLNCHDKLDSFKDDIDRVLEWFSHKNVNLALLYVDDIKKAAIKWGPNSKQVINKVKLFDFLMRYLLVKIRDRALSVNILITSDHGVTDLNWNDIIDLDRYIDHTSYILLHSQGILLIYPRHRGMLREVYRNLSSCPHLKVYLKENLPSHYHYTHHRRIPPIIAFVRLGAIVRSRNSDHKIFNKILKGSSGVSRDLGGDGYDPSYEVMKSVFFANGPSFRRGLKFRAINNTDIYGLVCHLLAIPPRANNGSFHKVKSMLSESLSIVMNSQTTTTNANDTWRPTGHKSRKALLGDFEISGLFWFLVASSAVMFLFCCIGCFNSVRKNIQGHSGNAAVHPPGAKRLLATYSSDED